MQLQLQELNKIINGSITVSFIDGGGFCFFHNSTSAKTSKKRKKLIAELDKIKLEIDNNRFEQEMIYYMEKFDINEEIIRLKSHLILFDESIKSKDPIGKKLGFICQEIGREINTLGSKANDAVLQKHVIDMKENLEKIKENILNIL